MLVLHEPIRLISPLYDAYIAPFFNLLLNEVFSFCLQECFSGGLMPCTTRLSAKKTHFSCGRRTAQTPTRAKAKPYSKSTVGSSGCRRRRVFPIQTRLRNKCALLHRDHPQQPRPVDNYTKWLSIISILTKSINYKFTALKLN